jgi:beta-N-acetylhexosaminidase
LRTRQVITGLIVASVLLLSGCVTDPGERGGAAQAGAESGPVTGAGTDAAERGGGTGQALRAGAERLPARFADPPADQAAPPPLTAAEAARLESLVDEMSLDRLLGQRFIIFVPGQSIDEPLEETIDQAQPAGFILYRWNYDSRTELQELTTALRELTSGVTGGIQPIITVDQEGGRVAALRFDSLVRLPSAHRLASYGDPAFLEAAGYMTGVQLGELGINMNLAPVMDVYGTPDGSIIGDRSYGGTPELVSRMGTAFIRGMHRAGVMAVAKHFPGHGVSTVDSHASLPTTEVSLKKLRSRHLPPFRAAMEADVDAIMTAHVLFTALDEKLPATLSPQVVQGLLRQELGYDGVVMSDGVEMGALINNFNKREIVRHTFRNGIDLLLLFSRYDVKELIGIARELVESGEVSEAELRGSAERVLTLKARYGLVPAVR